MVKLPLYIALCVALVYYSFAAAENPRLEVLGKGTYAIYSRQNISSSLILRRVSSGIGFIYYTDTSSAAALRTKFNNIDGESIQLQGPTVRQIFRKLGYKEVTSSGDIYYGYSPRGRSTIKSDGRRINLQIAERNGVITVGWPVILGTY